ncbi:hypothetical protein HA44_16800 [Mixta gaviniae]|nr:hypothetical protein HA44_16800 [Mixta gaviniae]
MADDQEIRAGRVAKGIRSKTCEMDIRVSAEDRAEETELNTQSSYDRTTRKPHEQEDAISRLINKNRR